MGKPKEKRWPFYKRVPSKIQHMLQAKEQRHATIWTWLGMFGLIGWSIAIPTIGGILIGRWLDRHWQYQNISWTLTGLCIGLGLGCYNAWRWIQHNRYK